MTEEEEKSKAHSEEWRRSCVAWQDWAHILLHKLGVQPDGGSLGDEAARAVISVLLLKPPTVPR